MQPGFDVAIVGGGPVGMAEACLLKCLNPNLRVCVLEARDTASRDYGITFKQPKKRLQDLAKRVQGCDLALLKEMENLCEKWSRDSFVRINEMQRVLAEKAAAVGVEIFRGNGYRLSQENMGAFFSAEGDQGKLSQELQNLKGRMQNVKVIVGADGAHSAVRQCVMGSDQQNLTDQKTYAYVLEVKHEVASPGPTIKYARLKTKFGSSAMGEVFIENVGKASETLGRRPVTDLIFVDKEVHKAFLVKNSEKVVLQGSPGKPWNLDQLRQKAQNNPVLARFLSKIEGQINRTRRIWGHQSEVAVKPVQVTTMPLKTYRSSRLVADFKGKQVVLIGDASSGLILRRGLNKGMVEAALCAEAIVNDLKEKQPQYAQLKKYEFEAARIYRSEKRYIAFKALIISVIKIPLKKVIFPVYTQLLFISQKLRKTLK